MGTERTARMKEDMGDEARATARMQMSRRAAARIKEEGERQQ